MKVVLVNLFEFEGINLRRKGVGVDESAAAPPIGLMTLAAILEQQGYEVELIDFVEPILKGDIPYDSSLTRAAAQYVSQYRGDIVGFTSRCDCYHYTLDMMRHYRELNPSTPLVLGGPQATITAMPTMEHFPFIDYLVRYEGDRTFPLLLEAIERGSGYEGVKGIIFRRNGGLVMTPEAELIENLDEVPIAAYKFFPPRGGIVNIEVGRGCPFRCTFCSTSLFFARSFRLKSPERLVEEIRQLKSTYGVSRASFIHDMFTANVRKVRAICERLLEANLDITWGCSARIDCVNAELLELMRASGCDSIYFGIESGSPRMQKLLKKGLKVDNVLPMLDVCNRLGIKTTTSFITGFPDELPEDVDQTLTKLHQCACVGADVIQLHLFSPYPGTPIMEDIRDRLVFTGYVSDAAYVNAPADSYYDDVIRSLPDLFCSYYQALPKYLSLEELRGIDKFGYSIQPLRNTVHFLLKEGAVERLYDLWAKLKGWLDSNARSLFVEETYGVDTNQVVAEFLALEFFGDKGKELPLSYQAFKYDLAMMKLVEQLSRRDTTKQPPLPTQVFSLDAIPFLPNHTVVTNFRCDVRELDKAVRRLAVPDLTLDAEEQPYAIVKVLSSRGARSVRFIRLNKLMAAVLTRCNRGLTGREIVEELWATQPDEFASFEACARACERVFKRLLNERLLGLREVPTLANEIRPGVLIQVASPELAVAAA